MSRARQRRRMQARDRYARRCWAMGAEPGLGSGRYRRNALRPSEAAWVRAVVRDGGFEALGVVLCARQNGKRAALEALVSELPEKPGYSDMWSGSNP